MVDIICIINDTITNRRAFFKEYIQHLKNVTYIFQVGKSDLVFFYSIHQKNVKYNFEVYLYKLDL